MVKLYCFIYSFLFLFVTSIHAQNVTVSGAVTGNGGYASLSAAFTGISGAQANANIVISINASFAEVASATLANNTWTSVTIQPVGGSRTITSTFDPLLEFNGADNVTVDGLGGNLLTLDNSSMLSSSSTVRFINDALNNTVTRCNLKGSSIGVANSANNGAVVWFSTSNGTAGNDNNTVSFCDIGPSGANLPYIGIRSYPDAFVPTRSNDNNIITDNTIHDFFSTASMTATNGINIFNYNSGWTISNNKIYQTSARTFPASQFEYRGISINTNVSATNGGGFTISGNTIGYASSTGTGFTTITGSSNIFSGILMQTATGSASSSITGNTISGIDQTSSRAPLVTGSTPNTDSHLFAGIFVESGPASITNNIIGAVSGTSSIFLRTTLAGTSVFPSGGIKVRGVGTVSISGNTIGAISIDYLNGNASADFAGMRIESGGIVTISGNTIGNPTANNITGEETAGSIFGIWVSDFVSGTGNITLSTNTIQNLNHTESNALPDSGACVIGIFVHNNLSVAGTLTYTISQNSILNLSNTSGNTFAAQILGMYLEYPGTHVVTKNIIYGLSVNLLNASTSAALDAIKVALGTVEISNNMISLGSSLTNNPFINAINLQGGIPKVYYNTVVLTGTATGSAAFTNAIRFQGVSSGTECINNIFYNNRTSATAANNHVMFFTNVTQRDNVTTCNYNNLYKNPSNTYLVSVTLGPGTPYADLATWQANSSGKDANSLSQSVSFANIASDLHVTDCSMAGRGTTVAAVITDYDASTRNTTPWIGADEPLITWNGGVGNWNTAANWTPNLIPASYHDVILGSGSVSLNADAVCHSLTISAGVNLSANIYKLTLGASSCINSFFVNNGTFNANTGTVQFDGDGSTLSGSIGGTTATTFNNVTLNTGVTFPASPLQCTVNSSLQLNSGSYVNANSPVYGSTSTLTYNTNGSYGVGLEWTSTTDGVAASGRPNNVTIVNSTVNMPSADRAMAGALTINLLGTLVLNATSGDLLIRGNWSDQGTFTPNSRAVFFTGLSDQTITRVGGGTESFPYFCINKPNAGTYVKPDNTAGNLTDVNITGTAGNVFQLLNNGSLDLNGRTVTLEGNNAAATTGYVYVNGARVITNSQGVTNGSFAIKSTSNPNEPTWFTKSVANNAGTGSLTFDQNVLVTIADGRMDFGLSAMVNLTTIQGVLQVNQGGSVFPNSCYFSASPSSTLRFANTYDYQVDAADKTWAAGALTSGNPGIPYNVEILNTNTDVYINDTRGVRNNLTITDGRLTLNAGPFNVGGNWSRTNPLGVTVPPCAFIPNTYKVVFDKSTAGNQTINCSANSNTETFYDLEISPSMSNVDLLNATFVQVSNNLQLTSGLVNTFSNELYITNNAPSSITGYKSNPATAGYLTGSWVNGKLRRAVSAGNNYVFPVGTSSYYEYDSLSLITFTGASNILCYYTYGNAGCTFPETQSPPVYVLGTLINKLLLGGYWTMVPNATPSAVQYDITLQGSGLVLSYALDDSSYAIIKRADCTSNWTDQGNHNDVTQQTYTTVPTYTVKAFRSAVTSFSDFAIGFNTSIILPVELTDFTVSLMGESSLLEWNTAAEYNSSYFSIERSIDGVLFEEIGKTAAAGFSEIPREYSYTDDHINNLGVTKIFYRLRMVDKDNSFEY